jgi:hypothetical protein
VTEPSAARDTEIGIGRRSRNPLGGEDDVDRSWWVDLLADAVGEVPERVQDIR